METQTLGSFPVRYLREASLLRACAHPNVMRLHLVHYRTSHLDLFSGVEDEAERGRPFERGKVRERERERERERGVSSHLGLFSGARERLFIELMTSGRKLRASREGSK